MIETILELLKSNDFYGVSNIVDIAKGKHELTTNIKRIYKQERRKYLSNGRKTNN